MDEAVILQDHIEQVYEITCSRCKMNYSVGAKHPYEAAQIMVDVGWRKRDGRILCGECCS